MNLSKPTAAVVGRRLRAYLGALLALGFGAAWWSFVPPAKAAAAVPVPHVVAHRVKAVPAIVTTTPHAPTNRLPHVPRPVTPRPRHHVVVVPPPVVVDVDVTPVVAPVVAPVVDPVVVPEPVVEPEIVIPHIRTRSS
jgi:hypothetical protein